MILDRPWEMIWIDLKKGYESTSSLIINFIVPRKLCKLLPCKVNFMYNNHFFSCNKNLSTPKIQWEVGTCKLSFYLLTNTKVHLKKEIMFDLALVLSILPKLTNLF